VAEPSLHQCSRLGEAILGFRHSGTFGSSQISRPRRYGHEITTRIIKAAAARPKDLGLKIEVHDLVTTQTHPLRTIRAHVVHYMSTNLGAKPPLIAAELPAVRSSQ
jgi:hypothetical protein